MSVMHSMSDSEKTAYKAQKLAEIREFNAEIIEDLGISPYDFNMKTPFLDKKKRLVVGIFSNEFKKPKGFFFELIDRDLNPTDPERKIYRVPPNNSFEQEYDLNEKGSYLVPLEELKVAHPQSVAISKLNAFTSVPADIESSFKLTQKTPVQNAPAPMEDAPYSEMTIRDYYAIKVGKPVSSKIWLNDLIKSTK